MTTAAAFPDWMAKQVPVVALSLAVAALLVILGLFGRDVAAAAAVRRARAGSSEVACATS